MERVCARQNRMRYLTVIYRLLVNAAFLAIGYYVGKEVGRKMANERHAASGADRIDDEADTGDEREEPPAHRDS